MNSSAKQNCLMRLVSQNSVDGGSDNGFKTPDEDSHEYRCWVCDDCLIEQGRKQNGLKRSKAVTFQQVLTPEKKLTIQIPGRLDVVDGNGFATDNPLWQTNVHNCNGHSLSNSPDGTNGVVHVDCENEQRAKLYAENFTTNNRLDHIVRVLGYHPEYLSLLGETQKVLLQGNGTLPFDQRHYVAMLASARHQCTYLVNSQINEYLQVEGDREWLQGFEKAPVKIQKLQEVNKIMAHRPWLLRSEHIKSLQSEGWSLTELMHAIVIMAHFHALSSFVYGCGVSPEIDHQNGHTYSHSPDHYSCHAHNQNNNLATNGIQTTFTCDKHTSTTPTELHGGIEVLMERMKQIVEDSPEEISEEEKLKRFQKLESQHTELPLGNVRPPKANMSCYIIEPEFGYQDFSPKNSPSDIPTTRAQDFSWNDHCQPLIDRYYDVMGNLLDEKFKKTLDLTYNTMGDNTDVDTQSFRTAVWNYIHCIYGIRQDDYDYSQVNQLLERPLKSYIKTVTCYPERVTKKEYDNFMCEFKHSEKVHVNLIILEARLQAELVYVMKAFDEYNLDKS